MNIKKPSFEGSYQYGGEGGIRTLDTRLTYTHFPGVLLQPLGHFTVICAQAAMKTSVACAERKI